jgi:hypothetical protein
VVSLSPQETADHFGRLAHFVVYDNPTSSALTREWFGWRPAGPSLLEDLDQDHYFDGPAR